MIEAALAAAKEERCLADLHRMHDLYRRYGASGALACDANAQVDLDELKVSHIVWIGWFEGRIQIQWRVSGGKRG